MIDFLGRFFDELDNQSWGRELLQRLLERRFWRIAFYHEAGHAVAWAVIDNRYSDLTAQNCSDCDEDVPVMIKKASYGVRPLPGEFYKSPLNVTTILSAGRQAERVVFDIESDGFMADGLHLRKLFRDIPAPPQPQLEEAKQPGYLEIDSGYPKTTALLERYKSALQAIGDAAFKEFTERGLLGQQFERTVILTAPQVQVLFEAHQPTQ